MYDRVAESVTGSGILWIASYPSSGNTWFRAFLSNLLRADERPVPIDDLDARWIASSRQLFDQAFGVESADLDESEIARLRLLLYVAMARMAPSPLIVKIHDAYRRPDGTPSVPPDVTHRVIVIIRNPLDVAVSSAHQTGRSIDSTIDRMADESDALGGPGRLQLTQHLGSWSSHVCGWADAPLPTHVVRYEDMVHEPNETFAAAVSFAGLPADAERITRAIEFSSFDRLKRQERETGFRERAPGSTAFFRRGRPGAWRDELSPAQAARIVEHHASVMRRFGYLDASGEPVF